MQNQTLYRKYRSTSLEEVVGQKHVTEVLASALKRGKTSHAYLLTGPRGTGKTSIARIFAHDINGIEYQREGLQLDIIEIDAASNRSIDNIRDLREKISLAPSSLKYKVYIIDEVHMLTAESFNALLKTLEEPPAHAIFILATTDYHKIPATILSRVQKFFFRPIALGEVVNHLEYICQEEGIKFDKEALGLVAENSEGSMRDALSLLDQLASFGKKINLELVEETLGMAASKLILELSESIESGTLEELSTKLKAVLASGADPASVGTQIYDQLKLKVASLDAFKILSSLLELGSSQQPKLALELALIKLNLAIGDESAGSSAKEQSSDMDANPKNGPEDNNPKGGGGNPEPSKKTNNTKLKSSKPTPKPSSEPKEVPTAKDTEAKNGAEEAARTQDDKSLKQKDFDTIWPEVKAAIGKKSPGLKACVGGAEVKFSEKSNSLSLSVPYQFHKKLLEEKRSLGTILGCFAELSEGVPKIEVKLNKDLAKKAAPKPEIKVIEREEPAERELSMSISEARPAVNEGQFSDIISLMGGGEAVQVPAALEGGA